MANRKVRPSEKRTSKTFSIQRKNIDGLVDKCEFEGLNPSEIVDGLIFNYLNNE